MKNPLSFLVIAFFAISLQSFAQDKIKKENTLENLTKGVEEHDEENYERAIELFSSINSNDTSYNLAVVEKALSLTRLEKYDEAILVCEDFISQHQERSPELFINLGTAYDLKEEREKSIQAYDKGLKIYPKNHVLLYNKGITLYKMEKYDEALETIKQVLDINPFHANSHFMLGTLAVSEGNLVEAMLSYNTYLLLDPGSEKALGALGLLDKIVSEQPDKSEAVGLKLSEEGDDFSEILALITSKVALSKNYKTPSKFKYPLVKQNHALFEKLEIDKLDKGYWKEFYVPFYKKIYDEDKFNEFILYILMSSDVPKIQAKVSKNINKLKNFNGWWRNEWYNLHSKHKETIDGKEEEFQYHYYNRYQLQGIGNTKETDNSVLIGYWRLYYLSGMLATDGNYNDEGKRTGKWTLHEENGKLSRVVTYKNDELNGEATYYYDSGELNVTCTYLDDKLEGEFIKHYKSGGIYKKETYKEDKLEGPSTIYYKNGKPELTFMYKDDKPIDSVGTYYSDGSLSAMIPAVDGDKHGEFKTYYRDGKLQATEKYKEGELDGEYINYYPNGNIESKGTYDEGKVVKKHINYYPDGTLSQESDYDESGKKNGVYKEFDRDGLVFFECEYTKGEITSYKHYDKSGKVINEAKRKLLKFPYVGYYADGTLKTEGDYQGSLQNGTWKYYDRYGRLTSDQDYKEDLVDGKVTAYHLNGKVESITNYKKDILTGYYVSYYMNGQMESQGWYNDEGEEQGQWDSYYKNGTLEYSNYLLNGEKHGWQYTYAVDGTISISSYYKKGTILKTILHDQNGNATDTIMRNTENVVYKENHFSGKPRFRGEYRNNAANGIFLWKFNSGKKETEGGFLNGERDGKWTWYYENGKVEQYTTYDMGDITGLSESFYDNGQKNRHRNYFRDNLEGEYIKYHRNGQIQLKGTYVDDERHGLFHYYDTFGKLQIIKHYNYGKLLGYSYHGNDGKPIAMIPFDQGTGKVKALYANGKTSVECAYKKGKLEGGYVEYYSNGTKWEVGTYISGDSNGAYLLFYPDGKPQLKSEYLYDDLMGEYIRYYENGKVKEKLTYLLDDLHGPAEYYDKTGKLIRKTEYFNSKVVSEENK